MSLKDVETALKEYLDYVEIREEHGMPMVYVKGFIRDKDIWAKINAILHSRFDYKYVSNKPEKIFRWEPPVKVEVDMATRVVARLDGIIDELTRLKKELER